MNASVVCGKELHFPSLGGFRGFRIAIVISYLQGRNRRIAEVEAAKRFIFAAGRIGIDARIFSRSEDVSGYRPDLVLLHSYQDPKLTEFLTYGTLTAPTSWLSSVDRFVDNISTYDGVISLSKDLSSVVHLMDAQRSEPLINCYSAFTVPATVYKKPTISVDSRATYVGTNWDKDRHGWIISDLVARSAIMCFGPKNSWRHIDRHAYGGAPGFDGVSVLDCYRANGIGLCLNHPQFHSEGVPTSRTFEIPASGAVMICGDDSFNRKSFGDAVFYIDTRSGESEACNQICLHLEQIKAYPSRAEEMSRVAHSIFIENFSLEKMIHNIVQSTVRTRRHECGASWGSKLPCNAVRSEDLIVGIEAGALNFLNTKRILFELLEIGVSVTNVAVVCTDRVAIGLLKFSMFMDPDFRNHLVEMPRIFSASARSFNTDFKNFIEARHFNYYTELRSGDVLVPRGLQSIILRERSQGDVSGSIVTGGIIERNVIRRLPELGTDEHKIRRRERRRLAARHDIQRIVATRSFMFLGGRAATGVFVGKAMMLNLISGLNFLSSNAGVRCYSDIVGVVRRGM